jgi:uncharacterized protein YdhG (YjbR/CyaY superfamily)
MAIALKNPPANTVAEYISNYPKDVQKILKQIRSIILEVAPDATESISYGIPVFSLSGSYVVYFGGFKTHLSMFPAPRRNEAFAKALAPYKGGKGTVQFPYDKPLPEALIRRIVKFQVEGNTKKLKTKKTAAKKKS